MRRTRYLALACLLAGCATAPTARQFDRTAQITSEFSGVWDAVIDIFGERSWAIDNMERASGLITTDWMRAGDMAGSYMDCGGSGLGVDRDHATRFNIVVREAAGSASLTVNTTHQTTRTMLGELTVITCLSTGVLEREIHEEVERRAGRGTQR